MGSCRKKCAEPGRGARDTKCGEGSTGVLSTRGAQKARRRQASQCGAAEETTRSAQVELLVGFLWSVTARLHWHGTGNRFLTELGKLDMLLNAGSGFAEESKPTRKPTANYCKFDRNKKPVLALGDRIWQLRYAVEKKRTASTSNKQHRELAETRSAYASPAWRLGYLKERPHSF
eukprot:544772-Pleurochrysis_carterae.AAC.1